MGVIILTQNIPFLLFEANKNRARIKIQMQAIDVDANNSGKVYITTGRQPVATVGHPGQGDILLQASAIEEPAGGGTIDPRWKEQIWVLSDTANQSIVAEEVVNEPSPVVAK